MTPAEVRLRFLGKSLKTIEAYLAEKRPSAVATDFANAWQSTLFEKFREDLRAIRGLGHLLDVLDSIELPFCIASSSSFERLDVALGALQLQGRFPKVFSAEQVNNGKPAPDLFLFAAGKMQCDPADCLVIEDSPHGIRAATAAGMRSFGFVGGSHLHEIENEHGALLLECGATIVISDYDKLLKEAKGGKR